MTSITKFIILAALAHTASAFFGVSSLGLTRPVTASALPALIYGWDGQEESTDTSVSYADVASDLGRSCSPMGSAVAEALSYDRERAGHLARLAVAFSPPDRALTLSRIENVEVICVYDDSIEIQAILCEDGGCVSLSVPIQFPQVCSDDQLEGCVMQNLDELDAEAGALLIVEEQKAAVEAHVDELGELCELKASFEAFPNWWVPPECYPHLSQDCETVRSLLNEAEFQADVNALAQDALRRIPEAEDFRALQTVVAILGPAGICFRVRVENEFMPGRPVRILEVAHPFDRTMQDVVSLRAAVLGAVAAAEGN